jgi:quinol monooxygenase YgiN
VAITINIYYTGTNGSVLKFAEEMISSGVVSNIRAEDGNIRYDYFCPMKDAETNLLIDSWENQKP